MPFAAAEDAGRPDGGVAALCAWLETDAASPIRRFTPQADDQEENIDAVIDVRAVFQSGHRAMAVEALPLLKPIKRRLGLIDYEKPRSEERP